MEGESRRARRGRTEIGHGLAARGEHLGRLRGEDRISRLGLCTDTDPGRSAPASLDQAEDYDSEPGGRNSSRGGRRPEQIARGRHARCRAATDPRPCRRSEHQAVAHRHTEHGKCFSSLTRDGSPTAIVGGRALRVNVTLFRWKATVTYMHTVCHPARSPELVCVPQVGQCTQSQNTLQPIQRETSRCVAACRV
jgi:hypothetical protein